MEPLPTGREASSGGVAPPYVRHRPERTLLYQIVEAYYPAFKAHLAAQGDALPEYVEQEFEGYLKCGRLEHGFLRVRCGTCHSEHLVAFSCKHRGFCPSCGARRMAESAALLVDEVFPEQPVRQWVLSVPYPLRFLFASRPDVMGRVLGIVYRCIATHLIQKAGFSRKTAQAGAVTLIQRFGSALNLNVHFHMLFLDGVYIEHPDGALRFRWVKAPTSAELAGLAQTLARRIGRFLERQGLLERDTENSYLAGDDPEGGPMEQLLGSSITYRIAVGPQQGRKVFTLQTLPACDESFDDGVGKVAGFSLHAGVAARADQRQKLERLCRYISRPAISEKRLSLTPNGNVRYQLKTPYRDGTTHVLFEPLDFVDKAEELGTQAGYFCPRQFASEWNVEENRIWLGQEILQQLPEGERPDALVVGIGTGGTLIGVGQAFREVNPDCRLVGMEPDESCTIVCGETGKHLIEGIADGFVPRIIQRHRDQIDDFAAIQSGEAVAEMRRIAQQHGCFVGPSSGGHLLAAKRLREQHPELKNVVTLFCDEGEKYLSEHFRLQDPNA